MSNRTITDTATIRRLAVACDADPRTVERVLRGEPIRGVARQRVARVLRQHGYLPPEASVPPLATEEATAA